MKKCLIISLIMMLVILGAWVAPVKAASASMGISSTSVTTGNVVRVTVNFGAKVKSAQFILNYTDTLLQFQSVSGGAKYNAGTKRAIYVNGMGEAVLQSVTFEFTTKGVGTANFSISGLKITTATQTDLVPQMANTSVSTTVKEKPEQKPDPKPDDKPNQGGNSGNNSGSSTNKPTTPTFTGGTATVYAKETVSIRDSWSTSGKLLGTLQKGKSITRTGIGSNGWTRVNYNGKVAYISSKYLTTTKPKDDDKKDDDKKDDKNNTKNETNNTTKNETTNNEVNNTTNNIENDEVNSTTNELTNNEHQGSNEVKNEKKDDKNYIEFIIIGVIVLAILVIIASEILAKKKNKQKKGRK